MRTIELSEEFEEKIKLLTKNSDIIHGISELIEQEKYRRINRYNFLIKKFESKYGSFEKFEERAKNNDLTDSEEQDYFDWDMSITAVNDLS